MQFGWFANPIFLGNWPQIMIDRIANRSALEGLARSRLPEFTQEEIDYINGTHDFFALNTLVVQFYNYQLHGLVLGIKCSTHSVLSIP